MSKRSAKPISQRNAYANLAVALLGRSSAAVVHRERRRELSAALAALGPVVYFIKFGPYVKIGYTRNLANRLRELGKSTTDLLAVIPGGSKEEYDLHQQFKSARVINELFRASPSLVEYINSVRAQAGVQLV